MRSVNTRRLTLSLILVAVCMFLGGCATSGTNAEDKQKAADSSMAAASPNAPVSEPGASTSGPNLISLASGAFILKRPSEWSDDWSVFNLLDENPKQFWATAKGTTTPQEIIIALPERTLFKTFEFDNYSHDAQFVGCDAKDVLVEVSDTNEGEGFQKVIDASLKDAVDNQRFAVSADVPGRWIRLTVRNNHGSPDVTQLADFRGYGTQLTHDATPDINGTYEVYFTGDLHLRQQGTAVVGCYESRQGRVQGGFEGKAFKFTWFEKTGYSVKEIGPGVMVFSPDRKQLYSLWSDGTRQRLVLGTKKSDEIGSCPDFSGGVEEQLAKDLEEFGRARLYGINFDSDSDRIKDESKPTLDKIVAILKAKPGWKITIEGHTDSTSTPQHNQDLSERRAKAVSNYLQAVGIQPSRLETIGFGDSKPVASNDSELGRSQNRRVELIKH